MFRPMAVTVVSSLAGSLFLALFIVPTLCSIALRHKAKQMEVGAPQNEDRQTQHKQNWFDTFRRYYERALEHSKRYSKWIFIVSGVLIVVALGSLKCIGTEFMPRLGEGSLVITSKCLPGISLTESIVIGEQIERTIKNFPEIQSVVTKLGRPDLATEAMGEYESDSYVSFTPEFQ